MTVKEILQIKNVRYFLMFRSSYFARFYYPVFTLLYLDYGLTLSQFAMLNVVWAATIVISEVPSGAFADTLGRKKTRGAVIDRHVRRDRHDCLCSHRER
jgi:MFS family permease